MDTSSYKAGFHIYLSISTASSPLGDYVQVRVSGVIVEEMLLKIKSSHKICFMYT